METGRDYDSVCTAVDTELYKLLAFEMLEEAGALPGQKHTRLPLYQAAALDMLGGLGDLT